MLTDPAIRGRAIALHLIAPVVTFSTVMAVVIAASPAGEFGRIMEFLMATIAGVAIVVASSIGFVPTALRAPLVPFEDRRFEDRKRWYVLAIVLGHVDAVASVALFALISLGIPEKHFGVRIAIFLSIAIVVPWLISWQAVRVCIKRRWLRTSNHLRQCSRCGYDISHSPGPACPECGEPLPLERVVASG